ncbi:thioredoxin family protein [Photobacterium sp. CAU 1568]|uniref:Thioredoxin family protein n=1 Tax=Photobacterium arenosum TaxID=2774143 RepID=A0ABR9BNY6_9GAMM|nr:thioredoxin family protein [Photobacterium arenosum]MBD8513953.1 thioredoxin family protein [Photobacterium arenosum]
MTSKRKIEIFSAGCIVCQETIEQVRNMACSSCEITVLDMHEPSVSKRAKKLGIQSLPAVVIDGRLADCCTNRGIDESVLRAAGVGSPLAHSKF